MYFYGEVSAMKINNFLDIFEDLSNIPVEYTFLSFVFDLKKENLSLCSVPEFQKRNFPTTVLVSLYEY